MVNLDVRDAPSTLSELVDVEIFARQLGSITEEMGRTMIRTSGDPVIAEVNDFSTVITDPDGELISHAWLTNHLGPARQTIRHLLDVVPRSQMAPGDAWICNDPYTTGACHAPDLGIVRPIFHSDELVAWCWAEAHMLDVGGMGAGGFAADAYECFGEALRFPGVKIVSQGSVIDDIWRLIQANFRLPERNLNQIRCFIAACNACDRRLQELLDDIGVDAFRGRCEAIKDLSERALRGRITALPDGVYQASDYVEHNGHVNELFEIRCTISIDGDRMTIDFTGSSPQTDGFVNCNPAGVLSQTITPLCHTLAPDVPVNEGMFRAFEFIAPKGTIVNPEMPAPMSAGHMEAGMRAARVIETLMAQIQAASTDAFVSSHVLATAQEAWSGAILYAPDASGELVPFLDMHGGAAGTGAQPHDDGLDCGGPLSAQDNGLPDIETTESQFPILYLWRRIAVGSGGPGMYRGGQGAEVAWTPWGTPGGDGSVFTACHQIPPVGAFGGYPGSTTAFELVRGTDIDSRLAAGDVPADIAELGGDGLVLEPKDFGFPMGSGDVLSVLYGGGAGLGDPIDRQVELVMADVRDGYVLPDIAERIYGVALDQDGAVAADATAELRAEIRAQRAAWPPSEDAGRARSRAHQLAHTGLIERDSVIRCRSCDAELAGSGQDWHHTARSRRRPAAEALGDVGTWSRLREGVDLVEYACIGCSSLLSAEIVVAA